MPLGDRPPELITEADLVGLIGTEPEGKLIDYKRGIVGHGDAEKKEFLYDVSSFANTQGGYLIFGMEEREGLPSRLEGIRDVDPDKEVLRLEQMIRDGIRPPISGVQTAAICLANGTAAIAMRIPKSWNPPHQVTYQKTFRFYGRDSNGKYQIDVDELRAVFSLSATLADKLKNFRIERIARIAGGGAPVQLFDGGVLVLHVIPFSAANSASRFPIDLAAARPNLFPTIGNDLARRHHITIDGLTVTSNVDAPPKPQRAYTQVYRTGVIESVASSLARGDGFIALPHIEALIIRYARVYMQSFTRTRHRTPYCRFRRSLERPRTPLAT